MFDNSCELSAMQILYKKNQVSFSLKNKEYFRMLPAAAVTLVLQGLHNQKLGVQTTHPNEPPLEFRMCYTGICNIIQVLFTKQY